MAIRNKKAVTSGKKPAVRLLVSQIRASLPALAVTSMLAIGGSSAAFAQTAPQDWNGQTDVSSNTIVYAPNPTTVTGTNVIVNGEVHGAANAQDAAAGKFTGSLSMNAGTPDAPNHLTIQTNTQGTSAQIQTGAINITGGTLDIGNVNNTTVSNWNEGAMLVGGLSEGEAGSNMSISNATVNLGNNGQLVEARNDTAGGMNLSIDSSTVNMNGATQDQASLIRATAKVGTDEYASMKMNGTTVNVGTAAVSGGAPAVAGYGVIMGRDVSMTDSTLNIADGSRLNVAEGVTGNTGLFSGNILAGTANTLALNNTDVNVGQGAIMYNGGTTNLNGGTVNVNGAIHGATDASQFNGGNVTGTLNMTDGTLNIASKAAGSANTAQVQMNTVNVSGGTLNIGNASADNVTVSNWDDGPMLAGGLKNAQGTGGDTTIDNAKVNLGNNGLIAQDSNGLQAERSLNISNSTVNMTGASQAQSSIIRAEYNSDSDYANMALSGTDINVGTAASGSQNAVAGYGVIMGHDVSMKDGSLTINEGSRLDVAEMATKNNGAIGASGVLNGNGNSLTLDGTAVNVAQNAALYNGGSTVLNNAETVVNGRVFGVQEGKTVDDPANGAAQSDWTGDLAVSGGSLAIAGSTGNQAQVQMNNVTLDNTTVSIGTTGAGASIDSWDVGPMLVSNAGDQNGEMTITGSTVNLGDNGLLVGGRSDSEQLDMTIADSTVNMTGSTADSASILQAVATTTPDRSTNLNLNQTDINVGAGNHGVILANNTEMVGGSLNVDGALTAAVSATKGQLISGALSNSTGEFSVTDGAIKVGSSGTLDMSRMKLEMNGTSTLDANSMTVGGTTPVAAGGVTANELALNGGSVNVNDFTQAGSGQPAVTVGGQTTSASLNVAGTLTNTASGIQIQNLGNVTANLADFTEETPGSGHTANQITVNGGGKLILKGAEKDGTNQLTLAEYRQLTAQLVSGNGLVDLTDITVDLPDNAVLDSNSGYIADNNIAGTSAAKKVAVKAGSTNVQLVNGTSVGSIIANDVTQNQQVTIQGGGTLEITGQAGNGQLVSGLGNGQTATLTADSGVLNIGTADVATDTSLNGSIQANNGTVNLVNTNLNIAGDDGINATNSSVNVSHSTLTTKQVTLGATSNLNVVGTLNADTVTGAAGASINIGNPDGRGEANIGHTELNGATLFADPVWKDGVGLEGASNVTINTIGADNKTIDGNLVVGQNSMLALGTTDKNWLSGTMANNGTNWSATGTTAAMGINSPMTIGTGYGVNVDGSLTAPTTAGANTATFAANSMLVVNAANTGTTVNGGPAALTFATPGTLNVSDSSKLLLSGAKGGNTYTVVDGVATSNIDAGGWSDDNLIFNSKMLEGTLDTTGDSVTVATTARNAVDIFPKIGAGAQQMLNTYYNTGDAANPFVDQAMNYAFENAGDEGRALVGGLDMAAAADLTHTVMTVSEMSRNGILKYLTDGPANKAASLNAGQGDSRTIVNKEGGGLWIMPVYSHDKIKGASIKGTGFENGSDIDAYGVIVGVDYTQDAFTIGAAGTVGTGDSKSRGSDIAHTKNDFDYAGGWIYGAYKQDNLAVGATVGYTNLSNDIKQHTGWGDELKTDPDGDIWNAAIEARYTINTNSMNVVPHIGLAYTYYKQSSYNTAMNGVDQMNVDSADMKTWQLPVGVDFNTEIDTQSGVMTPEIRFAYIPTFGDRHIDTNVSLVGVPGRYTQSGVELDENAGNVGLGLAWRSYDSKLTTGINVDYLFSDNRDAVGVNAYLHYKF